MHQEIGGTKGHGDGVLLEAFPKVILYIPKVKYWTAVGSEQKLTACTPPSGRLHIV